MVSPGVAFSGGGYLVGGCYLALYTLVIGTRHTVVVPFVGGMVLDETRQISMSVVGPTIARRLSAYRTAYGTWGEPTM